MGVDDFLGRMETVLAGYGFTGDNSIGELRSHARVRGQA
jgi:hypothetical protein